MLERSVCVSDRPSSITADAGIAAWKRPVSRLSGWLFQKPKTDEPVPPEGRGKRPPGKRLGARPSFLKRPRDADVSGNATLLAVCLSPVLECLDACCSTHRAGRANSEFTR